jgi:hypothetical protein
MLATVRQHAANFVFCLDSNPELEFLNNMGARNRVGIGLSYRPARLHRLAELIP